MTRELTEPVKDNMFEIKNMVCNIFAESISGESYRYTDDGRRYERGKRYWYYHNVNWKFYPQEGWVLEAMFESDIDREMVRRLLETWFKLDLNIEWGPKRDVVKMYINLDRFF